MVETETPPNFGAESRRSRRGVIRAFGGHLITYLAGGALTAAVYYVFLAVGLLTFRDRVPYLYVVVASNFVTVVLVYPWYRLVVFRGAADSWPVGYLRFYAVGLTGLVTSLAGLPVLVELAGLPVLLAQAFLIAVSVPVNYVVYRMWAFRRRAVRRPGDVPHTGGRIDTR